MFLSFVQYITPISNIREYFIKKMKKTAYEAVKNSKTAVGQTKNPIRQLFDSTSGKAKQQPAFPHSFTPGNPTDQ